MFAIGIWAVVIGSNFSFVTGNDIISGAVLLIVAGIITFVICVVGILGAIFKARPLLVVVSDLDKLGGGDSVECIQGGLYCGIKT